MTSLKSEIISRTNDRAADVEEAAEFLAQIVAGKNQRAAGVFLLGGRKIRGVTDLGLDLLLAVAEIVVGDDCDNDARASRQVILKAPPSL